MDKNTQENPERAFSQHCAHLPVFRDDRQAVTVHECQGRSISYVLPLLRRLPPNLPSQQELTGIPVSSFRAGMQKIPQVRSLPARQPFDFPLRCFTDAERPKSTIQGEANPKFFPTAEENPMT